MKFKYLRKDIKLSIENYINHAGTKANYLTIKTSDEYLVVREPLLAYNGD